MVKRCDMCFQPKETLVPVLPKMPATVCKACSYKIGQVVAFIEYHNGVLIYQPTLTKESPPTPPEIARAPETAIESPKTTPRKQKD